MNYQISDRLKNILHQNKCQNPQRICEILRGELGPIVESYITLKSPIEVRFKKEGDKMEFILTFEALRFKPVGYLP